MFNSKMFCMESSEAECVVCGVICELDEISGKDRLMGGGKPRSMTHFSANAVACCVTGKKEVTESTKQAPFS